MIQTLLRIFISNTIVRRIESSFEFPSLGTFNSVNNFKIFWGIFAFVEAQVVRYFDWQIKMGKVGVERTETKDRRNWLIVLLF